MNSNWKDDYNMFVGTCRVTLKIYEAYSLKDRRQVVRSLKSKLASTYGVAIADLDAGQQWNIIVLGLCLVSGQMEPIESIFQKIESGLEDDYRYELVRFDTDIFKDTEGGGYGS